MHHIFLRVAPVEVKPTTLVASTMLYKLSHTGPQIVNQLPRVNVCMPDPYAIYAAILHFILVLTGLFL